MRFWICTGLGGSGEWHEDTETRRMAIWNRRQRSGDSGSFALMETAKFAGVSDREHVAAER